MKGPVDWNEWVDTIAQDIDPIDEGQEPLIAYADGHRLDADLFLSTLADLEQRGANKSNLNAFLSARQLAGVLDSVGYANRFPPDEEPELPGVVDLYSVPLRPATGFPESTLVLCDPSKTTLDGHSVHPAGVAVLKDLGRPPESEIQITGRDIRTSVQYHRLPRGSTGEHGDADAQDDAYRRGTKFVSNPGDE